MKATVPRLDSGKCAVVFAEKATGILLTTTGKPYIGDGEFYQVFNSERDAEAFAQAYVESNPKVECSIRDCEGRHLRFIG